MQSPCITALASEMGNLDHVTPSLHLRAHLSTASHHTPHAHAFPFCLACLLSPVSSRRPPCAIGHLPPQIVAGLIPSPLQPSRLVRCTPKPLAQDQASPHCIGQHQNRKTLLLYVACIMHPPWPPFLKVWTSSLFRRIAAVYGIAQVDSYAFIFSFVLDIPLSIL